MKNQLKFLITIFVFAFIFQGCEDMDDKISYIPGLETEDFVYRGLNEYYLWKDDVPDLADDRFVSEEERIEFLKLKGSPETLFQDLLYKPISKFPKPDAVDRFSVIVSDYEALEKLFQGTTKNNGADIQIVRKTLNQPEVFGWVRYIIPNSDASTKNIGRGTIFYAVDGISMNDQNYTTLLSKDTYTLNLADYDNGNITPNGQSVTLTKAELTENPVFLKKVIELGDKKVGYLVYNGFTANFDSQLNAAFGEFKSAGITHLVLDLRYNSGGSIKTCSGLASMITGQFNGQLFAKQQWNSKYQALFEAQRPDYLVENFPETLNNETVNSLNLSKVFILTTGSTASASELLINGLTSYIDVVQIGTTTSGKNVGSITLYDSPALVNKTNISPRHKYAMQPLVIKTANKDGFSDYQNGLNPDFTLQENLGNLSQLGNPDELLLSKALELITNGGRGFRQQPGKPQIELLNSKSMQPFGTEMYIQPER